MSVIDTATDTVLATIPVGTLPTRVAVSRDGARAYVTNAGSSSVSVIDTASNAVVATVAVSSGPSAVAVTPSGAEAYVAAAGGVLQVIDDSLVGTAADPVVATLSFGAPGFRQGGTSIAFAPDGSRAYALVSGSLRVIDTASRAVLASIHVGSSPSEVAISADGSRAYVTNAFGFDTFTLDGQVVVLDTGSDSVVEVIPFFTQPGSIALTPDGARAYVASVARFANTGYGMSFIPDNLVGVIDLAAGALSDTIMLPNTPAGVAVTPDGNAVYVAIPGAASISVIDTASDSLADSIAVAAGPNGVAIGPAAVSVQIDIEPGNDLNAINPLRQSEIPVAILGSASFDVADVNAATLSFGPGGGRADDGGGQLADLNADGLTDLVSHFAQAGIAMGDAEACLRGETVDGTPFEACDAIVTVWSCGLGFEMALLLPPLMWLRRQRRRRIQ